MKRILLFLALLVPIFSIAQSDQGDSIRTHVRWMGEYAMGGSFKLPKTAGAPGSPGTKVFGVRGLMSYDTVGKVFSIYDGSSWVAQGGGGSTIDTTSLSNRINGKAANPIAISARTSIPFNNIASYITDTLTADIILTPDTAGAIIGGAAQVKIVSDGTHHVDVSAFHKWQGSLPFNYGTNDVNVVTLWKDKDMYWYCVGHEDVSALWAPFVFNNRTSVTLTGTTYTSTVGYMASTKKIALASGGAIRVKKLSSAFIELGLGLDVNSTQGVYNGFKYLVYISILGVRLSYDNVAEGGGGYLSVTINIGDYVGLFIDKDTKVITFQTSPDGETWVVVATFLHPAATDLYPKVDMSITNNPVQVDQPSGQNLQ